MDLKNLTKYLILKYPDLYSNALSAYNHLFCVNGNGFEWKDGELVISPEETIKIPDIETAVNNIINKTLDKKRLNNMRDVYHRILDDSDYAERELFNDLKRSLINNITIIFEIKDRVDDFSFPPASRKAYEFRFYPLCKYSKMCCIPEDIKSDYLEGIEKLITIMENNLERMKDGDGIWIEIVKQQIKKLKK